MDQVGLLADGEPSNIDPTGPHETVSGKLATQIGIAITALLITSPILPSFQIRLDDILPR